MNTSGTVVERYQYDAYGTFTVLDGSWSSRSASSYAWQYYHQGGRWDSDAASYCFRNRDLNPTLCRWMQVDPLGFASGDSLAYRYEGNNPPPMSDPLGTQGIPIIGTPGPSHPNPPKKGKWSYELARGNLSDDAIAGPGKEGRAPSPFTQNPQFIGDGLLSYRLWINLVFPSDVPKDAEQYWQVNKSSTIRLFDTGRVVRETDYLADIIPYQGTGYQRQGRITDRVGIPPQGAVSDALYYEVVTKTHGFNAAGTTYPVSEGDTIKEDFAMKLLNTMRGPTGTLTYTYLFIDPCKLKGVMLPPSLAAVVPLFTGDKPMEILTVPGLGTWSSVK